MPKSKNEQRRYLRRDQRLVLALTNHPETMTKSQEIRNLKYELACVKFQRDALLEMTWLDLPAEPDEESTKEWKRLFDEGWERKRCGKCHLTMINGVCPDCENSYV